MIEAPPPHIDRPAYVEPVSKRRNRDRRRSAATVGSIVILSDGTPCRIIGTDRNGAVWCLPLGAGHD